MARRTQQLSRSVAFVGGGYVVLALTLLWFAAPLGVSGLVLDRDLSIEAGSQLPASSVEIGDRVVAANGQAVADRLTLSAVLARNTRPDAEVTIEQRDRLRSATLSVLRFESDPPDDLVDAERIVRIDGRPVLGTMPVSELPVFLERADPTPVEVEYEVARTRVSGPLPVRRRSQSPLVLSWLGLGVIGILGVGFVGTRRLTARPLFAPLAATGLGALALAAITARLSATGSDPTILAWGMALIAAWRAAATDAIGRERGEPVAAPLVFGPATVALLGTAYVAVTAVGQETVGGWLAVVDQCALAGAAVGVAYLAAWGIGERREPDSKRGVGAIAAALFGALVAVFLFVTGRAPIAEAAAWAVLIIGATAWTFDLARFVSGAGVAASASRAVAGPGVAETLAELRADVPGAIDVSLLAGVDEEFVAIRLAAGDESRVTMQPASRPLSDFAGMLAVEGGMFPRHARWSGGDVIEDDPFGEAGQKLGIVAAVPLGVDRAGVAIFALARSEDDGAPLDLEAFVDAVSSRTSATLISEVVTMAAESVLSSARRAAKARDAAGGAPAPTTPAPATAPTTPTAAEATPAPADARWSRHLADRLRARYPIDEPDALNDREWLALAFLRESIRPALIVGEPGVGKEFVARAVHEAMWGGERRFAVVDCAEVPPAIVELELFGDEETEGLLDAVGSGTLLLKGASALGDARLEELLPRLVGSAARIVFAERYSGPESGVPRSVPRSLRNAVEDRNIHLSPLRDRPNDVIRYARYFVHHAAMRYDAMVTGIAPKAEAWLRQHPLPGNLHLLQALVAAAVLRADDEELDLAAFGQIGPSGPLPSEPAPAPTEVEPSAADDGLTEEERDEKLAILEALEAEDGNRTRAAEALGMTRGSFLRRLKKYGLS